MKIPLHIAEKLLLLLAGESLAASTVRHSIIDDLVSEGILICNGRIHKTILVQDNNSLKTYLQNRYSIKDIESYIEINKKEEITRAELVSVSADSKLKAVRTFKGFLVNYYNPIPVTLNNASITLNPVEGTFKFIYDFEKFIPSPEIIVVGMENAENFRHIARLEYLFPDLKPLFVSRYPQHQSKDLIKWLQLIPNRYMHFGDFDFAGIGIYINEYKKHLKEKASFFTPENLDFLIKTSGNRNRYDIQKINFDINSIKEENLINLIALIHKYKKGLDQELLIKQK
jgi:hypothetical protein